MSWKYVQRNENGQYKTTEGGGGGGASALTDLDDVNISSQTNGQVLKYNSTSQKWENANESGGGGSVTDVQVDGVSVVNGQGVAEITSPTVPDELSDLSDVQFNNLSDHQPLRYNATSQKWVNGTDNYPPLIYSDEEREVGVWRDGKPLYQRTFRGTTSSNDNAVSVYSDSEWNVVNCEGNIEESADKIQIGAYLNSSYYCGWYFDKYDSNTLKIFYSNQYRGKDYVITIYYTKTTDTAGSGYWATNGDRAIHYSTTEQIIGTWIDGKPLYEKVVEFGAFPNRTTKSVAHGISNVNGSSFVKIDMIASVGTSYSVSMRVHDNYANYQAFWEVDSTYITVYSRNNDNSGFTRSYFVLQYTKTTD